MGSITVNFIDFHCRFSAYNPVSLLTNPITGEWKRNVGRMILNTNEKYEQLIRRYQKMPENVSLKL